MDGHALLGSPRGGGAGQRKIGRTAFPAQYSQIAEGKAAQPGADSLQKGLLGRKIGGCGFGTALFAKGGEQGLLRRCKHMVEKARLCKAFLDAVCVTQVYANSPYHTVAASSRASRSLGRRPSITAVSSVCSVAPTPGPAGMPAAIRSAPLTAS